MKKKRTEHKEIETERFLSKSLLLLYLSKAEKKGFTIDHVRLKNDIQKVCLKLLEKDIFISFDFKPFGNSIYSEQLEENILWHNSIGLIEIKRGSIIYKITLNGEKELENCNSVYLSMRERVLKQMEKSIEDVF